MDEELTDLECTEDMSDLQILRVIDARGDIGDLSKDEGWAILAGRYPDSGPFLLLNIFEEVYESRYPESYPLEMLFRKLQRLLGLRSQISTETFDTFLKLVGATLQDEMDEDVLGQFEDIVMSTTDMPVIPKKTSEKYDTELRALATYSRAVVEESIASALGSGSLGEGNQRSTQDLTYDEWFARTDGQPEIAYSTKQVMHPGDRVAHKKFGVGFVLSCSQGRADILFKDSKRRLVCG